MAKDKDKYMKVFTAHQVLELIDPFQSKDLLVQESALTGLMKMSHDELISLKIMIEMKLVIEMKFIDKIGAA